MGAFDAGPSGTQPTGIAQAAQAFEAHLTAEAGQQEAPRKRQAAPAEAEEAEAHSTEADETASETTDDEEAQASEETEEEEEATEDEDQTDEQAQPEVDPETFKVTVKLDGTTQEVTLAEAVKGYQRGVDYARKAEALSHERKAFMAEQEQVRVERQQYGQMLTALGNQLHQELQAAEPDWDRLYQEDPIEWVRQRELRRDKETKLQAAAVELQALQAREAEERTGSMRQHLAAERDRLVEAIPDWKDKARFERDRLAIREYGKTIGFSDEELSQAYDHRAIVALRKAMLYDRMQAAKKPLPKPVPAKPDARPTSRSQSPRPVTDLSRAKMRLAQTGKVKDLAKVFESLI